MNIGEKIKYLRKQVGITQDQLAELTGIHPVSIRKYETNKMQPQPPTLEKLADALGVSYNALNNNNTAGLRLETIGDLMGLLIVLCNSGILQITGERGENDSLKEDTISICVNPVLSSYFEIRYVSRRKICSLSLQDTLLNINNPAVFKNLLIWEQMNFKYQKALNLVNENPTIESNRLLSEITESKELLELELQRSQMFLDKSNGIKLKINPNYYL